jgi:hypothetical protein
MSVIEEPNSPLGLSNHEKKKTRKRLLQYKDTEEEHLKGFKENNVEDCGK